jgi:hypothetical protein
MPVKFFDRSKRVSVTVLHVCKHRWVYPVHPNVSDAYKAEIAAGYAVTVCPQCRAQAARAETMKGRR